MHVQVKDLADLAKMFEHFAEEAKKRGATKPTAKARDLETREMYVWSMAADIVRKARFANEAAE